MAEQQPMQPTAERQPEQPALYDYEQVKEMVQSSIAFIEKKEKVTLEDDFFSEDNICVTMKNRDRPSTRMLILEKDTTQENLTDEAVTLHFETSFEEATFASLATTRGYTGSIGGVLGGGIMGGNIGLNLGFKYNRSKSFERGKSNSETKKLSAYVRARPKTLVIVKELVYKVEWAATCELELVFRKGDQVSYKYEEGRSMKENKIDVKKLLEKAKQSHRGVTSENTLSASLSSNQVRNTSLPVAKIPKPREHFHTNRDSESRRGNCRSGTPQVRLPMRTSDLPIASDRKTNTSSRVPTPIQPHEYTRATEMPLARYHHVIFTESMIIVKFVSDCIFNREERKLEIITEPSDPDRVKRIIDHQTGEKVRKNRSSEVRLPK